METNPNPSMLHKSKKEKPSNMKKETKKVPAPDRVKKVSQGSWDKWVKECVVSVSPDVWRIHASEVSHSTQLLADLKKIPKRVLLDTPAIDYLFRCPSRLSHNALLVLNDEEVECMLSPESLLEWADKMRTGHYLISRENGFFDKVLNRFDLINVPSTLDVYQKYVSMKGASYVEVTLETPADHAMQVRLNTDERPIRLIAAHALTLGVPVVSPDLRFNAYRKDGLKVIW
jgi:PIN domain nuclease of toxin-antitoxin system